MGNNATCKIVDIGLVQVCCHDRNREDYYRSLSGSWFEEEFDLPKYTLDKQNYKYMSERGTMKVTKGSSVMLKAKLKDGLYTLVGSTIVGSVNASIVQLSIDDKARLWHMKLGHISAQGLEMLWNQTFLNGEKIYTLEFFEHCVLRKQKKVSFSTASIRRRGARLPPFRFMGSL